MAFAQTIEFQTSRFEEMKKLGDEWEAAAGDARTARRRLLCQTATIPAATSTSCSSTPTSQRWYAGVLLDGPVATPAGVEVMTGPAWRERRRGT